MFYRHFYFIDKLYVSMMLCFFIFYVNDKSEAQIQKFIIESKIGIFNFDTVQVSEDDFVLRYGKGYVRQEKIGSKVFEKSRAYYLPNENIWIEIFFSHVLDIHLERSIEAVIITKNKRCDKKIQPKKYFGDMITSKGIKIGDSIDKVIRSYGKPSTNIKVSDCITKISTLEEHLKLKGGQILIYRNDSSDELLCAEYYFDKKSLHSILISIKE